MPARIKPQPETSLDEIDNMLTVLDESRKQWVRLSAPERAALLRKVASTTMGEADGLASACAKAKGSYGNDSGEEMGSLLAIVLALRDLIVALEAGGRPRPTALRTRPDGQKIAEVFPQGPFNLLFTGFRGELWIQKGREASQGAIYRAKEEGKPLLPEGAVALVLGAGNHASVVALDILHKLVSEDEVVLCKLNPVNDYIGPYLSRAFSPLVDGGYLRFAYGGRAVGEYLCKHDRVHSIHLTGSSDTFNSIVWGSPTAKREGAPPTNKRLTAELGNVTPHIIFPSTTPWTDRELRYHAMNVASGVVHNCGHNCVATQIIITSRDWPQRTAFLSALKEALNTLPRRPAAYPGSRSKYDSFRQAFPSAQELGQVHPGCEEQGEGGALPVLLVEGLGPEEGRTQVENWCTVVQEIALPGYGSDASAFAPAAADFVNTRCWGSLMCAVTAHPATMSSLGAGWEDFLASLKYGGVTVNLNSLPMFAIPSLSWGAYPGHTLQEVGSGIGTVHNTLLYDHPEKSVLYGPWVFAIRPFWWCDNRSLEDVSRHAMRFILSTTGGTGSTAGVMYHATRAAVANLKA